MLLYCLGSLFFSTPAAMDMLPYLKEELGRPPGGETAEYEHNQDVVMPGFRFHPTEEELVEFYLRRKVEGKHFNIELITVLDLYRYDPWELPAFAAIGEKEWFFYVPRDRKYRNGDRPNRVTASGYWKATGADRMIRNDRSMRIGLKKTLVFYTGKAPKGKRTTWIMNEYRLPQNESEKPTKNELSLCRVYKKPGSEEERLQARRRQNEGAMKETSAITATTTDVIHCSPPEDPGTCKNHGDEQQQHQQQQMMIIMECSSSTDKSRSSSSKAAFTAATEEALAPLQGKYNYGLVTAPDRLLENMQEGLMCSSSVVGWNHHVQNQSSNDPVNLCLGSTSSGNIYPSVPAPVPPQSHATSTVAPAHHSFAQQIHGGSLLSFTSALPTEPSTTTHKLWDWTSPARGNGSMD